MKVPWDHKVLIAWRVLTNYERFEHLFAISDKLILGNETIDVNFGDTIRCCRRDFTAESNNKGE